MPDSFVTGRVPRLSYFIQVRKRIPHCLIKKFKYKNNKDPETGPALMV